MYFANKSFNLVTSRAFKAHESSVTKSDQLAQCTEGKARLKVWLYMLIVCIVFALIVVWLVYLYFPRFVLPQVWFLIFFICVFAYLHICLNTGMISAYLHICIFVLPQVWLVRISIFCLAQSIPMFNIPSVTAMVTNMINNDNDMEKVMTKPIWFTMTLQRLWQEPPRLPDLQDESVLTLFNLNLDQSVMNWLRSWS